MEEKEEREDQVEPGPTLPGYDEGSDDGLSDEARRRIEEDHEHSGDSVARSPE